MAEKDNQRLNAEQKQIHSCCKTHTRVCERERVRAKWEKEAQKVIIIAEERLRVCTKKFILVYASPTEQNVLPLLGQSVIKATAAKVNNYFLTNKHCKY